MAPISSVNWVAVESGKMFVQSLRTKKKSCSFCMLSATENKKISRPALHTSMSSTPFVLIKTKLWYRVIHYFHASIDEKLLGSSFFTLFLWMRIETGTFIVRFLKARVTSICEMLEHCNFVYEPHVRHVLFVSILLKIERNRNASLLNLRQTMDAWQRWLVEQLEPSVGIRSPAQRILIHLEIYFSVQSIISQIFHFFFHRKVEVVALVSSRHKTCSLSESDEFLF